MKDRYLFRGKRIDNFEFVTGRLISINSLLFETPKDAIQIINNKNKICKSFIVNKKSISQYTGLSAFKSYRGKSQQDLFLFGGDKFIIAESEIFICEYKNGGFGWYQYKGKSYEYFIGFSDHNYLKEILSKLEIIGNINDEAN